MAACGRFQHIFENSLPENPKTHSTWNQIKPIEESSSTEIFGELHFKETSNSSFASSSSSSSFHMSSSIDFKKFNSNKTPPLEDFSSTQKTQYMNDESLHLCTEGLGFESSDDVEDMINGNWEQEEEEKKVMRSTKQSKIEDMSGGELKRSRTESKGEYPPPISCIGESGKPLVCFESYREDGRFVLKEMRIPTPEFLHACREGGRLKLHFVQPNSEITEGDDEEEEEDNDVEEGNSVMEDEDLEEIGQK